MGWNPSQPDPGSGRFSARLRPYLGGAGALGGSSRLGRHRSTAFGPNVCASQGPPRDLSAASSRVPDQAGDGSRGAAMGPLLAEAPVQAAVRGGRRGVRQGSVPQTGDGAGNDGGEPAAQGRSTVDGPRASRGRSAWQAAHLRREPPPLRLVYQHDTDRTARRSPGTSCIASSPACHRARRRRSSSRDAARHPWPTRWPASAST